MKTLLLIFASILGLQAQPVAVAWTTPTAPCWTTTTGPCWATFTAPTPHPLIAVPWDTSGNHTNKLYGTGSTGTGLTYQWSEVSGPSTVTFSPGSTNSSPTIGNVVAGYYVMHLRVTDSMAATSDVDLDVGAIGIDANGAVIYSDDATTGVTRKIFGPIIALGYDPWGREDERFVSGTMLQIANNTYYSGQAALWSVPGAGTVSYPFSGVGFGLPGASLNGACASGAATCAIHNAERLSLTSLPTWIQIGNQADGGTLFRVCNTSATTGDATLTFCYDGRGVSAPGTYSGNNNPVPDQTWPDTAVVGEYRIQGTSTLFATDSQRPICPAGVPGPPGPVVYSTGTVALNHAVNPTVVVGSGTTFTSAMVGDMIRVTGTTHGGTPFVFWRRITAFTDTTHMTMDHAYPSDADDLSGLSYAITGQRIISLEFQDPSYSPPANYQALQFLFGCESETAAFGGAAHDLTAFNATTQSGVNYSYINSLGANGAFGPNFYGTGLGEHRFFLRSGYAPALTAAYLIDDYWIRDPQNCGGYCEGGQNYNFTGSFVGGVADLLLNPSAQVQWSDVRPWAAAAVTFFNANHTACNTGADTRDQSAFQAWLVMPAMFDPDPTYNASWLTALGSAGSGAGVLGRDQLCKQSDNSFALNAIAGAEAGVPVIHFINGSATGTLVGTTPFPNLNSVGGEPVCNGVASGTIQVMAGSASATLISGALGSNATNYAIIITDTISSPNYIGFFEFSFSGSAVTLAGLWPGSSGTFNFVVNQKDALYNTGGVIAIGPAAASSTTNAQWAEGWTCTMVDNTHITLNRPWDDSVTGGHTTGDFYFYPTVNFGVAVGGYMQLPYQLGMKARTTRWSEKSVANATINAGYTTINPLIGQWTHDVGYDQNTDGVYFARVLDMCEPYITPNSVTKFYSVHGLACGGIGLLGFPPYFGNTEFGSRVNSAETMPAFYAYFEAECSQGVARCNAARTFVDGVYGGIYGNCDQTAPTYFCDTHFVDDSGEMSNVALGAYRWFGFFFGLGDGGGWPAERLAFTGGTTPSISLPGNIRFSGNLRAAIEDLDRKYLPDVRLLAVRHE